MSESADLLDTYLSSNWSYYIAIFVSILFFIAFWNVCAVIGAKMDGSIKERMDCVRKPGYWLTICAILDLDQFPAMARISFSTISLCSSLLFWFLIDCFILNQISTDSVVVVEPRVVKSYPDIMDRDVRALCILNADDNKFFSHAKYGTIERDIWDKKRLIVQGFDGVSIQKYQEGFLEQRYVGIIREWAIHGLANTAMPIIARINDKYRLYVKSTGQSFDAPFMMRTDIDPRISDILNRM